MDRGFSNCRTPRWWWNEAVSSSSDFRLISTLYGISTGTSGHGSSVACYQNLRDAVANQSVPVKLHHHDWHGRPPDCQLDLPRRCYWRCRAMRNVCVIWQLRGHRTVLTRAFRPGAFKYRMLFASCCGSRCARELGVCLLAHTCVACQDEGAGLANPLL